MKTLDGFSTRIRKTKIRKHISRYNKQEEFLDLYASKRDRDRDICTEGRKLRKIQDINQKRAVRKKIWKIGQKRWWDKQCVKVKRAA